MLDLNDHVLDSSSVITGWSGASNATYTFYNTVRGGKQGIATLGLNWYINTNLKMQFQYQFIDVTRLQSAGTVTTSGTPLLPTRDASQSLQTAGMRLQISF